MQSIRVLPSKQHFCQIKRFIFRRDRSLCDLRCVTNLCVYLVKGFKNQKELLKFFKMPEWREFVDKKSSIFVEKDSEEIHDPQYYCHVCFRVDDTGNHRISAPLLTTYRTKFKHFPSNKDPSPSHKCPSPLPLCLDE